MVFLIFLVLGILSAIAAMIFKNKLAIVASLVFVVITIIIPVGIYSSNIGKIADLEAFYNASATNFQISRDDTASYLSEDKIQSNITLIPITGSIERMGVGQSAANRVLEYRNSVNAYNTAFAKYRAYKRSMLYGIAYPEVPSEMRLLIINPVQNGSPNNVDSIDMPSTSPAPDTDKPSVSTPTLQDNSNTLTQEELKDTLQTIINQITDGK